jgi:hypothetical protein
VAMKSTGWPAPVCPMKVPVKWPVKRICETTRSPTTSRCTTASQVTGRGNYGALGAKVGLDLVNEPDLVNAPANALECGVADFIICGCLPFAQADNVTGVTMHLNGGFTGLDERTLWLARWKTALGSQNPALHSTTWLQVSSVPHGFRHETAERGAGHFGDQAADQ